ncbi:MAG: DNA replication/repair protein RecF [Alphaproteobacteria bacterium]|nr:DNA replication/repair protein RecF [Alphaproteobacteria bacterium]
MLARSVPPQTILPRDESRTPSATMRWLSVTDFRCYTQARLNLDGRPVVLTGENGAGKTNLLEALSFLAPGRGLRWARLSEVTRIGAPAQTWAVAAGLDAPHIPGAPMRISTGLLPASESGHTAERRTVRIDGSAQSSSAALAQLLAVSWLTPDMDRLFAEGASGRRQFFDRLTLGFDTGHGARLNAYERARQERSRLLRDEMTGRRADPAWLDALEAAMAEHGVAIAASRCETLQRLVQALEAHSGPFPHALLALDGLLEDMLADTPAVDVEDRYRAVLAAARQRDKEAGRALEGPHRSDLLVWHGETRMPAGDCSTGQQKALLISIVLANARILAHAGATPLLLLDEVVAHLDARRRAALYDAISDLGAQTWMTGTDRALFDAMGTRAQYFTVTDGAVADAAG